MRILLVSTFETKGGAAIACKRLMTALNKHGHEAKMLVMDKQTDDTNVISVAPGLAGKVKVKSHQAGELMEFRKIESDAKYRFQFSVARYGFDITKTEAYDWCDVVNLHWINQGMLSLKNIEKLQAGPKPVVWTLHDMWAFTGGEHYSSGNGSYRKESGYSIMLRDSGPNDMSHKRWLVKRDIYTKLRFVTCSEWLRYEARSSSLLNSFAVEAVPNPLDYDAYARKESKSALRSKWGVSSNKKIILFGAFNFEDERKGMAHLKMALKSISRKDELQLVVFGKGDEGFLKDIGIDYVQLGSVPFDSMKEVYALSDAFVIPSLEDNLPNTIMESMSCECPVVAFATGGIPEMIDHKVNGYLAKYKDAEDLAAGIEWVIQAEADLGKAGREKVIRDYNEQSVVKRYVAQYQNAISNW